MMPEPEWHGSETEEHPLTAARWAALLAHVARRRSAARRVILGGAAAWPLALVILNALSGQGRGWSWGYLAPSVVWVLTTVVLALTEEAAVRRALRRGTYLRTLGPLRVISVVVARRYEVLCVFADRHPCGAYLLGLDDEALSRVRSLERGQVEFTEAGGFTFEVRAPDDRLLYRMADYAGPD
jgi:hypothetical protein